MRRKLFLYQFILRYHCVAQNLKSIICLELQNSSEVTPLPLFHCCVPLTLLLVYKNISAVTCRSGRYWRLHKVVSCMYRIWSSGLACNPRFLVPLCFNKMLVECEWLTKLTGYVRYAYQYILYIPLHIPIYYLFTVVCFTTN